MNLATIGGSSIFELRVSITLPVILWLAASSITKVGKEEVLAKEGRVVVRMMEVAALTLSS